MKRFVIAAIALAFTAPALAQPMGHQGGPDHQPPQNSGHHGPMQAGPGPGSGPGSGPGPKPNHQRQMERHAWKEGDRFDRRHAPQYGRVDYGRYGLQPPPPGHVWVRSGTDALLVILSNNLIVAINSGVFR